MDFSYQATESGGKTLEGRISARDRSEVLVLLRKQGLIPVTVEPLGAAAGSARSKRRIGPQEKAVAVRELATLLTAGVSLVDAVQSLAQVRAENLLGEYFNTVESRLRGGDSLSKAMLSGSLAWPPYVYQLVVAGEQTGNLGKCLEDAAGQMEYEEAVRQEARSALIYPVILVVAGLLATLIVFIVVVPKFANLLRTGKTELPMLSVWVLKAGVFTKEHTWGLAFFSLLGIVLAVAWARKAAEDGRLFAFAARVPILGELLMQNQIGIWAEMMGNLLENKVPLLKALELSNSTIKSRAWRDRIEGSLRSVRGGKALTEAMRATNLFDSTALNLMKTGEKSGQLPLMLRTLARMRRASAKENTRRFLALVEPVAILLIGGVIGTIMIAVMMAITSINNISF